MTRLLTAVCLVGLSLAGCADQADGPPPKGRTLYQRISAETKDLSLVAATEQTAAGRDCRSETLIVGTRHVFDRALSCSSDVADGLDETEAQLIWRPGLTQMLVTVDRPGGCRRLTATDAHKRRVPVTQSCMSDGTASKLVGVLPQDRWLALRGIERRPVALAPRPAGSCGREVCYERIVPR